MSEETQVAVAPAPASRFGKSARLLLLIAATVEFLGGLAALPILAGDLNEIPGPGVGGAIIIGTIILRPIAAAVALFAAARGYLTAALFAMAVVILLNWADYLPSVQIHGLELDGGAVSILSSFLILILPPILVVAVSGLALLDKRLTLAALLAVVPTLIGILATVAFGIGVSIYGF
jgi:hypothetical protein